MDDEERDEIWMQGNRTAWRGLLYKACSELGYVDPHALKASWILERESAIAMLRQVCDQLGDNDWPNDLDLSDIIEKHVYRHL